MKCIHNDKGLTLIEIILSIAILGIILTAFLSTSTFGVSNLFFSGQKSESVMDLQSAMDDLNAHGFMTTSTESAQDYIINFLETKGYHYVSDPAQIFIQSSDMHTNFYVSASEVKAGTRGNSVTILKFTQNEKRTAQLSTFLPDRGF